MQDQSELDKKYFIDEMVYNCPFCNRRNVEYFVDSRYVFNWSENKTCFIYIVKCTSCEKLSMHLSYESILASGQISSHGDYGYRFSKGIDIDSYIFYSVPTSFFVIDNRIPRILRELVTEADGCLKMNYLTGASACARKTIYELLVLEKAEGVDYESRIKSLKKKHTESDPTYYDILSHIQDMTSDKVHEQSWDKWDSHYLKLILETLKSILYDIYVSPKLKEERKLEIEKLRESVTSYKKTSMSEGSS